MPQLEKLRAFAKYTIPPGLSTDWPGFSGLTGSGWMLYCAYAQKYLARRPDLPQNSTLSGET